MAKQKKKKSKASTVTLKQIKVCKVSSYLPITRLKFHPRNKELRRIDRGRLDDMKDSIVKKGFYEPILVWKKGAIILAGNHRVRGSLELIEEGYEFVTPKGINYLPVVVEDVDKAMAEQILHESNAHYAQWVEDRLASALKEAQDAGENLRDYGYSVEDVDRIMDAAVSEAEALSDEGLPGEVNESLEKAVKRTTDTYESLLLPKNTYNTLMGQLGKVAKALDPKWKKGDSVVDAVNSLCQLLDDSKALEKL